jgi:hypothetical protein
VLGDALRFGAVGVALPFALAAIESSADNSKASAAGSRTAQCGPRSARAHLCASACNDRASIFCMLASMWRPGQRFA